MKKGKQKNKELSKEKKGTEDKRDKFFLKKKIFWIMLIFSLLLLGIFVFLIISEAKSVLKDELQIEISPLQTSFFINNNEEEEVKFNIRNNNFKHCKTECSFYIFDLKNNKRLYEGIEIFKHKEEKTLRFILPKEGRGSGQHLYQFNIECRNIKSIICNTDELPRYSSSLIILNYELSDEEEELKNNLKTNIEKFISLLNDSLVLSQQNNAIIDKIPSNIEEREQLVSLNEMMKKEIANMKKHSEDFYSLWREERYYELNKSFSHENIDKAYSLNSNLSIIQKKAISLLQLRNQNIRTINDFVKLKEKIIEILSYYIQEANLKNKERFNFMKDIISNVYNVFLLITEKTENTIISEYDVMRELNKQIQELKTSMEEYESNKIDGAFLSLFSTIQLNQKQNLSFNFSTDFNCDRMKELIYLIEDSNNASISYMSNNYPDMLDNETFNLILKEIQEDIEYNSLIVLRDYLQNSNNELNNKLLNRTLFELKKRNSYQVDSPIGKEEIYKMVLLNNQDNKKYVEENCGVENFTIYESDVFTQLNTIDMSLLNEVDTSIPEITINFSLYLPDNLPKCCVFNVCDVCCDENCVKNESEYPVLFIHGHAVNEKNTPAYSMNIFKKIQNRLQDEGYINGGVLDLTYFGTKGDFGRSRLPITFISSYYYIKYLTFGRISFSSQKSERIENYALRLKEIIDIVKYKTNAKKINIVAHSMGGLVAREYIALFGGEDIHKLILINTPNHGISEGIYRGCVIFGADKECDDMREGSIFLRRLNAREIPNEIKIYAIRSTGCVMGNISGDGIVTENSAFLEGAENYLIKGECKTLTDLHSDVLDPDLYPEAYNLVVALLKK